MVYRINVDIDSIKDPNIRRLLKRYINTGAKHPDIEKYIINNGTYKYTLKEKTNSCI